MNFIQRQHSFVKFLIYLAIIFIGGFMLSVILGLIFSGSGDVEDWVFTLSYIIAFLATAILAIVTEHNLLFTLKEQALALRKDISIAQSKTENVLFQLENLLETHMSHEKDMYIQQDQIQEKNTETSGLRKKFKTMAQVRNSVREHPNLRSDQDVKRLFDEIVKCHEQLMNQKTLYNNVAAKYNAGTQKVLAKIFSKFWKLEKLNYYTEEPDILLED